VSYVVRLIAPEGRGGQHVGSSVPDVVAIHVPTGYACVERGERSLHRRREVALAKVRALVASLVTSGQIEPDDEITAEVPEATLDHLRALSKLGLDRARRASEEP
jgi:protein subunit release factor A